MMAARSKWQLRRSTVLVAEITLYRPGVVGQIGESSPKTGHEFVLTRLTVKEV